jgi:uncharacterized protein YdaL
MMRGVDDMDISNAIAAYSVTMSAAQFQQKAGIAVMKKALETQEVSSTEMLDTLNQVAPPTGKMDISI